MANLIRFDHKGTLADGTYILEADSGQLTWTEPSEAEGKVIRNGALVPFSNVYAAGDEGKVVSSGALVTQTARSSEITENGVYDTTLNNSVEVNVSGGGGGDVEPSLPAEYQEVEYIDFDGASYVTINSDYVPSTSVIEACLAYINSTYTSEEAVIGVSNSSGARFDIYMQGGKLSVWAASCIARGAINSISNAGSGTLAQKTLTLNQKEYAMLELFVYNDSSYLKIGSYLNSTFYHHRLYKIRHRVRQDTIGSAADGTYFAGNVMPYAWYKPCYRKSDNVPGWYDTRTDTFYTNAGSGAFTVGPDVS